MKNYLTLEEVKEALQHPEEWYVPYIPLLITPLISGSNGAQANLVEAED